MAMHDLPPFRMTIFRAYRGYLILVIVLPALLLMCLGDAAALELRYQREPIMAGEWWRMWTGHWVHLSWSHLWLNLAGFLVAWLLVGSAFSLLGWLSFIAFSPLFISLGLFLWQDDLQWYVGLSGILHGLIMAGAVIQAHQGKAQGWILILLLLFKLIWEFRYGADNHTEALIGGTVIIHAHLYGVLSGAVYALSSIILPSMKMDSIYRRG